MLRKLLKLEFKATGRTFLPLYLALIILAVVQRISMIINSNVTETVAYQVFSTIIPTLFGVVVVAICAMTLFVMIQRFHKNLLGNEGYLMFTLPVKSSQLIWSKLIPVIVWCIVSVFVGSLAFMILFVNPISLSEFIQEFKMEFSMIPLSDLRSVIQLGIEFILLCIAGLASQILSIYMCLAIGHLASKHRILTAFGVYVALNIVLSNMMFAFMSASEKYNIFDTFMSMPNEQTMHYMFIGSITLAVVESIIYFIVTKVILEKRLNLE